MLRKLSKTPKQEPPIVSHSDEIAALQLENADLKRQIRDYRTCAVYGILTRTALEADWAKQKQIERLAIAFLDIDDLKLRNAELGQDETNRRIAKAFSLARSGEVIEVVGRFFSGDEFVILAPTANIFSACNRLMTALSDQGMSATAAIVLYKGQETLAESVREAGDLVARCKAIKKGRTYNFLDL